MSLRLYGDPAHRMTNVTGIYIPADVEADKARGELLTDFGIEIGTSFGPLHGKIWRIGTMGYVCMSLWVFLYDFDGYRYFLSRAR